MSTKNLQKSTFGKIEDFSKKSHSNLDALVKTDILGIGITNATEKTILEFLKNSLQKSQENYYIVTPNPEMIVASRTSFVFRNGLNNAKIALNDGVGLSLAAKFLGKELNERIPGVDFVKSVCAMSNDWPITVGFLGGGPKIAERASDCLRQEFPKLRIVYVGEEWNQAMQTDYSKQTTVPKKAVVRSPKAVDVLFIALGAPKQEFWMAEHLNKIPVRVMVGVGGSFDYISGNLKRAPKWVQRVGFEWLFRLLTQPWRWKRQLALLEFMWLVIREKFSI